MIVVGGVYSEYCHYPSWDQLFGSGGRGAAALTRLGVESIRLFTCLPDAARITAQATLAPYGVELETFSSSSLYEFTYNHPLSDPSINPFPTEAVKYHEPISGDVILVYGMLEGLPRINGRRVVFDPQSETDCQSPTDFIETEALALVLNQNELETLYGKQNPLQVVQRMVANGKISAVVVKQGAFGCTVIDGTGIHSVPVFPSEFVFKIGSGDIFSASFAKFWAVDNMSPVQAALNASKCASLYCDSRSIDSISLFNEFSPPPRECRRKPVVYLAGPFFSLAQRFLVEETRAGLLKLGVEVFSPMHEVGFDLPVEIIAKEDLKGLERCSVVLALITDLDPGTIFEIGFARARNIPVVAFGEGVKEEHLTMLIGTECMYSEDFCSALYNSVWAGM